MIRFSKFVILNTIHKLKNWVIKHKLNKEDYIFFSASNNQKTPKGKVHLKYHTIDEYFKKGFDWIGVKGASSHSFRRSMATNLLNKGFSLREIMHITGHKNIATLQEYLDVDKSNTHQKYKQIQKEFFENTFFLSNFPCFLITYLIDIFF